MRGHDGARRDDRAAADRHARQDGGVRPHPGLVLDGDDGGELGGGAAQGRVERMAGGASGTGGARGEQVAAVAALGRGGGLDEPASDELAQHGSQRTRALAGGFQFRRRGKSLRRPLQKSPRRLFRRFQVNSILYHPGQIASRVLLYLARICYKIVHPAKVAWLVS